MKRLVVLLILNVQFLSFALADETKWKSKAEFRFENFAYQNDEVDSTQDYGLNLFSNLEVKSKNGDWLSIFRVAARNATEDKDQSSLVLEEAWIGQNLENIRWKIGAQKFNWSSTEAFHPVDVINSRNYNGDEFEIEKIGEPGIELTYLLESSELGVYYFPILVNNIFPSANSRKNTLNNIGYTGYELGSPVWVDGDQSKKNNDSADQIALVYKSSLDSFDFNIVLLKAWDKQLLSTYLDGSKLRPVYFPMQLIGFNSQLVYESWLFKFEVANKKYSGEYAVVGNSNFTPESHSIFAWGSEYTQTNSLGHEYSLLIEGQHIFDKEKAERVSLSIFQNDILLGVRYAFNDENSKEFFISYLKDLERNNEEFFNFFYSQRFWKQWKIKAGIRAVNAKQKDTQKENLEILDGSNQLYSNISYFF